MGSGRQRPSNKTQNTKLGGVYSLLVRRFFQDLCSCCSPRRPTLLHFSTRDSLNFNRYQEQGCRLSRRPQKGQRLICLVFFEICFSLWFRSDSLSVSPEPELQIHCVFQGFLFFFQMYFFFPCKRRVFLGPKKIHIFWSSCSRYTYIHTQTHTHIYI